MLCERWGGKENIPFIHFTYNSRKLQFIYSIREQVGDCLKRGQQVGPHRGMRKLLEVSDMFTILTMVMILQFHDEFTYQNIKLYDLHLCVLCPLNHNKTV